MRAHASVTGAAARGDNPVAKGTLCAADAGFNLHAATRVAANDSDGRERLCRYILRPSLANDRLFVPLIGAGWLGSVATAFGGYIYSSVGPVS